MQLAADPTGQLAYDKDRVAVKAGKVAIRLISASSVPHNVTIAMGTRIVAQPGRFEAGARAAP